MLAPPLRRRLKSTNMLERLMGALLVETQEAWQAKP